MVKGVGVFLSPFFLWIFVCKQKIWDESVAFA